MGKGRQQQQHSAPGDGPALPAAHKRNMTQIINNASRRLYGIKVPAVGKGRQQQHSAPSDGPVLPAAERALRLPARPAVLQIVCLPPPVGVPALAL